MAWNSNKRAKYAVVIARTITHGKSLWESSDFVTAHFGGRIEETRKRRKMIKAEDGGTRD
jgi:hypothetical protein